MGCLPGLLPKKHLSACIFIIVLILGNCCGTYGNNDIVKKVKDGEVIDDAAQQARQLQKVKRFWVIRPCAIEWSKDNPETGEMFVAYSTEWYRFLVPDRIKRVGWNDWAIPGITQFGVIKDDVIYGEMKNDKWFITKPGDGSLPVFFSNRDAWLEELTRLGANDTPQMVNIRDGYHSAQKTLWIKRIAYGAIFAGVVSLPWMIARYLRLRKNLKKGSKSSSK